MTAGVKHYAEADRAPIDGVVRPGWREAVVDDRGNVERVGYELCALAALRAAIRRREIWIVGAGRWRNPETDPPPDFDLHRDMHYTAIAQPTDPSAFVTTLKARVDVALTPSGRGTFAPVPPVA